MDYLHFNYNVGTCICICVQVGSSEEWVVMVCVCVCVCVCMGVGVCVWERGRAADETKFFERRLTDTATIQSCITKHCTCMSLS